MLLRTLRMLRRSSGFPSLLRRPTSLAHWAMSRRDRPDGEGMRASCLWGCAFTPLTAREGSQVLMTSVGTTASEHRPPPIHIPCFRFLLSLFRFQMQRREGVFAPSRLLLPAFAPVGVYGWSIITCSIWEWQSGGT